MRDDPEIPGLLLTSTALLLVNSDVDHRKSQCYPLKPMTIELLFDLLVGEIEISLRILKLKAYILFLLLYHLNK
jgi:hypothetical protein